MRLAVAYAEASMNIGVADTGLAPSRKRSSYDKSAQDLFARFTTPPTSARKAQYNTLIKALKSSGVWSKLDALYILAAADRQAAQRNLIADQFNLSEVNGAGSGLAFVADRYYAGDAVGAYLESSCDPTTSGGKFALNDATLFSWEVSNMANSLVSIGTNSAVGRSFIIPRTAANAILVNANDNAVASLTGTITDSSGLFVSIRSGATARRIRKNKTQLESTAEASTSMTASSFTLFKRGVTFSARQLPVVGWGSALTDPESDALYDALFAYLTGVGAV